MLNKIWGVMIVIGVVVSAFSGKLTNVTNAVIESSKDAISLCITMLGIVAVWTGLMKIAEEAGLVGALTKKMRRPLNFLFPNLPENSPAKKYIATNIIANILGLGWAATPAGLMAMKEMQKLNKDKKVASTDMCTFLIINMSSLQLIAINIIAFRTQYNSINPSEIIAPGLIATLLNTLVAVIISKILARGK